MPRSLLISLLALLLAPAAAEAATRYAAPAGLTAGTCTTPATACRLDRALSAVVTSPGDEVVVMPGTHDLTAANATIGEQLDVHGQDGAARPVILDADNGTPIAVGGGGGGTELRFLEIRSQGTSSAQALSLGAATSVRDVVLRVARQCLSATGGPHELVDVEAHMTTTSGTYCVSSTGAMTLRRVHVTAPAMSGSGGGAYVGGGSTVEDSTFVAGGNWLALTVIGAPAPSTVRRVRARGGAVGVVATGEVLMTDSLVTSDGPGGYGVLHSGAMGQGLRLRNVTVEASGAASRGIVAALGMAGNGGDIHARNVIARGPAADLMSQDLADQGGFCVVPPCLPGTVDVAASNFRTLTGSGGKSQGPGNQSADPRFAGGGDYRLAEDSPAIDAGVADLLGPKALDGGARVQGAAVDMGAHERAPAPAAEPEAVDEPPAAPPLPPPPTPAATADVAAPVLSGLRVRRRGRRVVVTFTSSETGIARLRVRRGRRVVRTLTRPVVAGVNRLTLRMRRVRQGRHAIVLAVTDAAGNAAAAKRVRFRVRT